MSQKTTLRLLKSSPKNCSKSASIDLNNNAIGSAWTWSSVLCSLLSPLGIALWIHSSSLGIVDFNIHSCRITLMQRGWTWRTARYLHQHIVVCCVVFCCVGGFSQPPPPRTENCQFCGYCLCVLEYIWPPSFLSFAMHVLPYRIPWSELSLARQWCIFSLECFLWWWPIRSPISCSLSSVETDET